MNKSSNPSAHRVFSRSMLFASIGSISVFSIADQNPAYFMLSMLGITLVWVFSVRPNRPAPRLMINSILFLVVVIAGVEMLRQGVGVSAFAVFVTLLMIVKMLDLRVPRDDGQILILNVSILIAAVLTSNTLLTGIFMLVEIVLILRAVVLFQIHDVLEKSKLSSGTIDPKARVDIRSMILATGFLCTIIGSMIFVILPRNIGVEAFGQWGQGRSVSGFADTVELGRPGFISQSSIPVLDLTITNRDGVNIGAENTPPVYLRGAVLKEYDNGRWDRSPVMSVPLTNRAMLIPPGTALHPRQRSDTTSWDQQFNISIRSSENGPSYLFAPWKTVEFRVQKEPMRLGLDFERGIFLKDGIGGKLSYSVRSMNTEFDEIDYAKFTKRSPITPTTIAPGIKQLAQSILIDADIDPDPSVRPIRDDVIALRVLQQYLQSQYDYTLDAQPVPPGQDATKWFLLDYKKGHCEYFASSLALMSRSIGVPSRVLTGYIVSDFNAVTGQYVVRESNAHAWIEAEIAPGNWRIFDGTPPADFHAIHEPDPSLWRSLTKMYESVEFLWVRSIIGYDSTARENIIGGASSDFGLSGFGETLLNRFAAGRDRLIIRAGIIAGIVFSISMFIGIVMLKYKAIFSGILGEIRAWIRHLTTRIVPAQTAVADPRCTRLESALSQCLEQLEIPKPSWIPLKAHLSDRLESNETISEPTRDALLEASRVLYRLKFAPGYLSIDADAMERLESILRKSEKFNIKGH